MSEINNANTVAVETVKLTREQKIAAKLDVLKKRIEKDTADFNELAAEAVEAAGEEFEVIPLTSGDDCDRLFIAPREERSFARSD